MTTLVLIAVFVVAAGFVWQAGIRLSHATDTLSERFGLGNALGGLLFLAIATNLPEIAITVAASVRGNLDLAIGNLLGGVAIQTVVLVLLDAFGPGRRPLSGQSRSLSPVLEATLVIAVLLPVIMGSQLEGRMIRRIEPLPLLIALVWIAGVFVIKATRSGLPWVLAEKDDEEASADDGQGDEEENPQADEGTGKVVLVFAIAALVTLAGGVALEFSGDKLATHFGINGVVFGATFLAAATALPEVATGFAAVRIGQVDLALSDIFGGNAFLPTLLLLANLISGEPVLAHASPSDIYLTALGCLVTVIYIVGLLWRRPRTAARMGLDSWLVLLLYVAGIAGLTSIH